MQQDVGSSLIILSMAVWGYCIVTRLDDILTQLKLFNKAWAKKTLVDLEDDEDDDENHS